MDNPREDLSIEKCSMGRLVKIKMKLAGGFFHTPYRCGPFKVGKNDLADIGV